MGLAEDAVDCASGIVHVVPQVKLIRGKAVDRVFLPVQPGTREE